jgi:hypothetical protein
MVLVVGHVREKETPGFVDWLHCLEEYGNGLDGAGMEDSLSTNGG